MVFSSRIILLSAILAITTSALAQCSRALSFAYGDWSRDAVSVMDNQYTLELDMLAEVMKIAGCEYSNIPMTYKRVQHEIEHGRIDGTVAASITPARRKYAWFTVPYRQEIMAMFMFKSMIPTLEIKDITELKNYEFHIGAGIGTWHGEKFETLVQSNQLFKSRMLYTDDFALMHNWILRGRAHIALSDKHLGMFLLKLNGLDEYIGPHPLAVNDSPIHIMLSKKSVPESDAITLSAAISELRKSQRYRDILKKYGAPYRSQ